MNYNIAVASIFKKHAKRLLKKYPSLKSELEVLFSSLQSNPHQGTPLGNQCFKIRMAIHSKGKGKSGGARIITHVHISKSTIYLLTIYDKSEQIDIPDKQLKELLKLIPH